MCANNDPWDAPLRHLMAVAASAPRRSHQRREALTNVVRLVKASGKLWREYSPEYDEALSKTWLYLCQKPEMYDPNRGNVITWLNSYLRYRLLDERQAKQNKLKKEYQGNQMDPLDNLPAPSDPSQIWERTQNWIETDPQGVLRRTHLQGRPDVNCQVLLLKRFPPPMKWKDIAQTFELSSSVAPTFYQRKCLPLLRKFGEDEGFL